MNGPLRRRIREFIENFTLMVNDEDVSPNDWFLFYQTNRHLIYAMGMNLIEPWGNDIYTLSATKGICLETGEEMYGVGEKDEHGDLKTVWQSKPGVYLPLKSREIVP